MATSTTTPENLVIDGINYGFAVDVVVINRLDQTRKVFPFDNVIDAHKFVTQFNLTADAHLVAFINSPLS